jgi:hypothetical protein
MKNTQLIILILASFLFSPLAQAKLSDYLKPGEISSRIRTEIADLDVSFGANLFDLDLFEGIGLSARYRYEVEPSYQAGFHTRVDRWRIKADLNLGDILDAAETPLYLKMKRDQEIFFVRQFKSKKKALTALPYHIKQLPITAKKAISGLTPGDLVSMPAEMTIAIGAQASSNYVTSLYGLSANANIYYMLSGRFQVQVYRMKENKVRLKLIAMTAKGVGTNAGVEADVSVFGISIANKLIEKIFEMDIAKLGTSVKKGEQFIIDYVFDLNAPKAQKAYDQILSSTYKFKDLELFQEFLYSNDLENRVISNYELAEDLYEEDRLSPKKRVNRIFKGFNKFTQKARNLKLGLLVASFKKNKTFTKNVIAYQSQETNGMDKYFYYPVYNHLIRTRLGIGFLGTKGKIEKSLFGLVPTGKDGADIGAKMKDFGYTYELKDKIFRRDEQANFKEFLHNHLNQELFDQIDFKDFERYNGKKNARVFFRLVFKEAAFDSLKGTSERKLRKALKKFYKERKEYYADPIHGVWGRIWHAVNPKKLTERSQIKKAAAELYKIANESMTGKEKLERLLDLRKNHVFSKVGFAFIADQVPVEQLEKTMSVSLTITADDVERVDYKFGTLELSQLYYELRHAHNAIMNRSFDLRLNQEEQKE